MLARLIAGLAAFVCLYLAAEPARAQDAAYQAFFANVCFLSGNLPNQLGDRCRDSSMSGPPGDLSGASESSLDPNQGISNPNEAIERVRQQMQLGAQRLEAHRAGRAVASAIDPQRSSTQRAVVANAQSPFPPDFGASEVAGSLFSAPVDGIPGLSLLVGARGSLFDRDRSGSERGYDGYFAGAQLGADYRVSDRVVVGGFFGYDRLESDFDQEDISTSFLPPGNAGSRDGNTYFFTVFGSYNFTENLYADLNLGGGVSDYELRRDVVFQPSGGTVADQILVHTSADTDSYEISSEAGLGYDVSLGSVQLGPYGRLRYVRTALDGYTETGGSGLAMNFGSESSDSLALVLGVRESFTLSTPIGVLVPEVRAEWEHEFLRDAVSTSARFNEDPAGAAFAMRGDGVDRNYANIGAGAVLLLAGGWMPYFDYEALLGFEHFARHRLSAGLRLEF